MFVLSDPKGDYEGYLAYQPYMKNYTDDGYVDFAGFKTYWKSFGNPVPGKKPLVCVHGGPGISHESMLPLALLNAKYGRQVIFYDQLGTGKSTIPPQGDDFWTLDLAVRELDNLVESLGLGSYHLLGCSWGGLVVMQKAIEHDDKIASLVVNSSTACVKTFNAETSRLIWQLPEDMRDAIVASLNYYDLLYEGKCDAAECADYDEQRADEALDEYNRRYVIGTTEYPQCVIDSFARHSENESWLALWGPSDFKTYGSLRDFDIRADLDKIQVPTLVISGTDDYMTPYTEKEIVDGIEGCEWELIRGGVHMGMILQPDAYGDAIESFLERHDA